MACPTECTKTKIVKGVGSRDQVYFCDCGQNNPVVVKPVRPSANLHECHVFEAMQQFCDNPNRMTRSACAVRQHTQCTTPGRLTVARVPGTSIESWRAGSRDEWKYVAAGLIDAVLEMWRHGVTHRDIKPENIMVDAGGQRVVLLDFGTACPFDQPELCVKTAFGSKKYLPFFIIQAVEHDIRVRRDMRQAGTFSMLHRLYGSARSGLLNVDAFMTLLTIHHVITQTLATSIPAKPRQVPLVRQFDSAPIARMLQQALQEETLNFLEILLAFDSYLRPGQRNSDWDAVLHAANPTRAAVQALVPANPQPVYEYDVSRAYAKPDASRAYEEPHDYETPDDEEYEEPHSYEIPHDAYEMPKWVYEDFEGDYPSVQHSPVQARRRGSRLPGKK